MGSVYIIDAMPDDYDSLLLPVGGAPSGGWADVFQLDGKRRGSSWKPVPMERHAARLTRHRGKPVDFPSLGGMGLAFSQRALDVLRPLVGDSVEALTLTCSPDTFYVINVLDVSDALDEDRSEIRRGKRTGAISGIVRYVFKSGATDGHHIFTLKQLPLGPVLVSEEFKRFVEEKGLIGLRFTEVGAAETPRSR